MAHVRRALSADLKALAALCRAAVGPEDYVLEYLPEMIGRKEILVTVADGRIRAMTGLTECADGALWIGQLRTHPRWRRRGFARMLLDHAYARVIRERRPALRLWTSQRNITARALFESNGFRPIGMFSRMVARPTEGKVLNHQDASASGVQHVLRQWNRSVFAKHGRGYLDYRWRFTRLNARVLRTLVERGEVATISRSTLLIWNDRGDRSNVHVAILAGGRTALQLARRTAGGEGFSRIEAFLPRTKRSLALARQAGFKEARWGTRAILFERLP